MGMDMASLNRFLAPGLAIAMALLGMSQGCGGGGSEVPSTTAPAPKVLKLNGDYLLTQPGSQAVIQVAADSTDTVQTWTLSDPAQGGFILSHDGHSAIYLAPGHGGVYSLTAKGTAGGSATISCTVDASSGQVGQGTARASSMGSRAYVDYSNGMKYKPGCVASGGRIYLVGGANGLDSMDVLDPSGAQGLGSWATLSLHLLHGRTNPLCITLDDGSILVAGGMDSNDHALVSAERVDPAKGTVVALPDLGVPKVYASAMKLQDGRVLILGGANDGSTTYPLSSAEVFDPGTNTFTPCAPMSTGRRFPALCLLSDGKVLVSGGEGIFDLMNPAYDLATQEVFDPSTLAFTTTGDLGTGREGHGLLLQGDGKVLIAGGRASDAASSLLVNGTASEEIWDPASGTCAPLASTLTVRRAEASTLRLASGKWLWASGWLWDGSLSPQYTLELYDPASGSFLQNPNSISSGMTGWMKPDLFQMADGRVFAYVYDGGMDQVKIYFP